ncbi:hypothetical protein L6V77_08210 [Myxococcota bacterium]|nr:hypothetical protein [Myxococcota bacterium]
MAMKSLNAFVWAGLVGCSANPLDPDRIGCIETALGNSCDQTSGGGGSDPCAGACNALDQCTPGGLASQGASVSACQSICAQGQLAAPTVVECLSMASTCEEANLCAQ